LTSRTIDLHSPSAMCKGDAEKKGDAPQSTTKLLIRGCIPNSGTSSILFAIAHFLGLWRFVAVAAGLQLAVFAAHGLPQTSGCTIVGSEVPTLVTFALLCACRFSGLDLGRLRLCARLAVLRPWPWSPWFLEVDLQTVHHQLAGGIMQDHTGQRGQAMP